MHSKPYSSCYCRLQITQYFKHFLGSVRSHCLWLASERACRSAHDVTIIFIENKTVLRMWCHIENGSSQRRGPLHQSWSKQEYIFGELPFTFTSLVEQSPRGGTEKGPDQHKEKMVLACTVEGIFILNRVEHMKTAMKIVLILLTLL